MTIQARLADGRMLNFPDGTDQSVIQQTVKNVLGENIQPIQPVQQAQGDQQAIFPGPMGSVTRLSPKTGEPTGAIRTEAGKKILSEKARPVLEAGGGLIGGMLGAPGGPPGVAAGGVLGFAIGKESADVLDIILGYQEAPKITEVPKEIVEDLTKGAIFELTGQGIGKAIPPVVKASQQAIGKLTGTGHKAIIEAAKGGEKFTEAMRGKIGPEEIVENARDAISVIKDSRASLYQEKLAQISKEQKPINMEPIAKKLDGLMKRYNVKTTPDGEIDVSRIAMGKKGRKDILDIIKTVSEWNRAGDDTAVGLDILKRQLDDFWSDSSQARGFVTSLKKAVKETIEKTVPKYGEMTKEYAEATKLIKDIESGLMLRKKGMSGRIVADQTLRRLMSAMKENFALRGELLDALGAHGGKELSQQVGGFTMSSWMPVGLAGTGPALVGNVALAKLVSPAFWPVIAASSPRVSGEFIRMLGKASAEMAGSSPILSRTIPYAVQPKKRRIEAVIPKEETK
jgi:hypothetical protein